MTHLVKEALVVPGAHDEFINVNNNYGEILCHVRSVHRQIVEIPRC